MSNPTLFYRKILIQDLEEKMHRVEFCLSHSSKLIQDIDKDTTDLELDEDDEIELDNSISEAKAFIFTGHDNVEELRTIYQELKDRKYQDQDRVQWLFTDYAYPKSSYFDLASLPDLKDLVHEFKEKMRHAKTCLFHSKERVQQLDDLIQQEADQTLIKKIIELNSFVCAGYQEIQQLKDLYRSLEDDKIPVYNQLTSVDASVSESLKGILHA